MSPETLLRILLIALVACGSALLIKGKSPGHAMLLSGTVCLVLLALLLPYLSGLYQAVKNMMQEMGLDANLFLPLVKVIAITEVTRVTAELCRDAGEKAVAAKLEFCGAVAALFCVLPLMEQALDLIGALGT